MRDARGLRRLQSIANTAPVHDELIKYALFTPLIQYDENLEVTAVPRRVLGAARRHGVVFQLRRDVHWHDGQPVTAEDVKFTFDLAKDPATASLIGSAYLTEVESAEVVDSYTIRFTSSRPHAQALEDFWWAPLPKHLLEERAARRTCATRRSTGSRWVAGRTASWSGARTSGSCSSATRISRRRWAAPPQLDRVVFRIIPEASTMLTELLTGGVQVDIPVVPDQAEQIKGNANLELFAFPGRTVLLHRLEQPARAVHGCAACGAR